MRDKTIGSWDRVLPVHVGTMKRRGGGVKSIAMQTVGHCLRNVLATDKLRETA